MDKLTQYRQIVRDVLIPIAQRPYSTPTLAHEAVFDETNDRYLVLTVGWEGRARRIHHCLIHLDIIDGKIWIQRDGTEDGIAYELEDAGVPKSDIVLAFHSEDVRPHTGYAVA
jgi:hypothetical protein